MLGAVGGELQAVVRLMHQDDDPFFRYHTVRPTGDLHVEYDSCVGMRFHLMTK